MPLYTLNLHDWFGDELYQAIPFTMTITNGLGYGNLYVTVPSVDEFGNANVNVNNLGTSAEVDGCSDNATVIDAIGACVAALQGYTYDPQTQTLTVPADTKPNWDDGRGDTAVFNLGGSSGNGGSGGSSGNGGSGGSSGNGGSGGTSGNGGSGGSSGNGGSGGSDGTPTTFQDYHVQFSADAHSAQVSIGAIVGSILLALLALYVGYRLYRLIKEYINSSTADVVHDTLEASSTANIGDGIKEGASQ